METNFEEDDWERYRKSEFPSNRINLNTATLGLPSKKVQNALVDYQDEVLSFPLDQYNLARHDLKQLREEARDLWQTNSCTICFTLSATQTSNMLANVLLDIKTLQGKREITVLASPFEHSGGIGPFESHPRYKIMYLNTVQTDTINTNTLQLDLHQIKYQVRELKPDIAFVSHVAYTNGAIIPVEELHTIVKQECPNCIFIVDAAQSIGILSIPFGSFDILVTSLHKWFFGPHGVGIMWIKDEHLEVLPPFFPGGDNLDSSHPGSRFELCGGQNFHMYRGIRASVDLHKEIGLDTIQSRCADLSNFFYELLCEKPFLESILEVSRNNTPSHAGIVPLYFKKQDTYPIYTQLNDLGIHVKCIRERGLLRISIPYYETRSRLQIAADKLILLLCGTR